MVSRQEMVLQDFNAAASKVKYLSLQMKFAAIMVILGKNLFVNI